MDVERREGILISLLASFSAACTPILSKVLLQYFTPGLTLMIRMLTSAFILYFIIRVIIRTRLVITQDTLRIALFGSLNFVLFIFAIKYMPAYISPIFYCLVPIEVTILSFIIYREKITPLQLFGIIVGYIGAVIVVFPSFTGKEHESIKIIGLVLIVVASISIAMYSLLIQMSRAKYSPYNLSFQAILLGGVLSIPATFLTNGYVMTKPFNPIVLLYFFGLAIIGTIGQYVFLQLGISKIKASANVVFFYFQPIFVLIMSVLFLGEKIQPTYFLGLAVVLIGSSLNIFADKPKSEEIIETN